MGDASKFQKASFDLVNYLTGEEIIGSGEAPWMKIVDDIESGNKKKEKALNRILCFFVEDHHKFAPEELDLIVLTLLSSDNLSNVSKYILKTFAIKDFFWKASFFEKKDQKGLHSRALQAVISQDIDLPKSFWMKQLRRDQQEYGLKTFVGIRKAEGLNEALDVLRKLDLNQTDLVTDLHSEWRGLIRVKDSGVTKENFEESWEELKDEFNIVEKDYQSRKTPSHSKP